jgi:hypothetical protein
MTPFAPFYDASIAGTIAAATLAARAATLTAAFAAAKAAPAAEPHAPCETPARKRGVFAFAFDLISGPQAPPRNGASNI